MIKLKFKIYYFCAFFLTECTLTCRETPVFGGTSLGRAGLYHKLMRILKHPVIQKFQTRATEHFNNISTSVYRICSRNFRTLIFKGLFGFIFAPRISRTTVLFIYDYILITKLMH